MCPELFPCSEVIGWILPHADPTSRIISDIKGEAFSSFHPAHIAAAYKLPPSQVMLTEDWIKGININLLEYAKQMVVLGKQLRQKASIEYECQSLRTPFRIIALLLSRIFGRADQTIYKLNWVPLIYYIAF